jgi:hypothetical protein
MKWLLQQGRQGPDEILAAVDVPPMGAVMSSWSLRTTGWRLA